MIVDVEKYYKLKQFVYNGEHHPPEVWGARERNRYCFSSNYWLIYTRKTCAEQITPFGLKLFSGEVEKSNGDVYYWFMNTDETILVNAPTRQYLEGMDICPIPQYVFNKIREIYNNIKNESDYYKKMNGDESHYHLYTRKTQKYHK